MNARGLGLLFPRWRGRLWLARDQWVLLLAAVNELFLSLDTYLVHVLNGTIRPREWVPILFGAGAGVVLLVAGLLALRHRRSAAILATLVFLSSIAVGVLGAYFHLVRGLLPTAAVGQRVSLQLLIWAPPVLAPFAFAGVGIMGLSAAWLEEPWGSGRVRLFRGNIQMPYSKSQAYLFLVSLGILVALVSSILDHSRAGWENAWLWLPVQIGIFAVVVCAGLGFINQPSVYDVGIFALAMLLLVVVGMLGAYFHIRTDLTADNVFVAERFLRGAPFLSPLLFSNMGMLGLLVLLEE